MLVIPVKAGIQFVVFSPKDCQFKDGFFFCLFVFGGFGRPTPSVTPLAGHLPLEESLICGASRQGLRAGFPLSRE
jgi:hypothetical protein